MDYANLGFAWGIGWKGSTRAALKTCHDTSHYPGAWSKAMPGVGLLRILVSRTFNFVARGQPLILAKAGIHLAVALVWAQWIPAFAGMTVLKPLVIAFQNESTPS